MTAGTVSQPPQVRLAAAWRRLAGSTPVESSPAVAVASTAMLVLAFLACWLVAFGLLLSGLQEGNAQYHLYARFRGELSAGTAPLGGVIARGVPVAVLTSTSAGLNRLVVVEGTSSSELRDGPGHLPGTPLPGQAGSVVIMGRSTTFGAPFGSVTRVKAGDDITAVTGEGTFTYVVTGVRRPHDPLPPPLQPGGSQLTLVTSEGGGWRSGWAPQHQVYVDALLKGTPAGIPSGTGFRSQADLPMHGDSSGMYPLILWLQLLLITVVGGTWAGRKWGWRQAWLVAVPIGLAALWGATENVWLVLPNLM